MEIKVWERTNRLSESETSLLLDTYMYLNYYDADEGQTLSEIMQDLAGLSDYGTEGIHGKEYEILQKAIEANPELGELQIGAQSHQLGFDSGTQACVFQEKETGHVYLVYRGTGDGEWMDNGAGLSLAATPQQKQALSYFEKAMEYGNFTESNRLIVTGHSKGGNKAQYVTMESKYGYLIDKCISVDGQGFSEEAISQWQGKYKHKEYEARINKLYGINGENDFIHVLGHSLIPKDHIRYLYTPTVPGNVAGYHDIKYLFATREETGELTFCGQSNYLTAGMKEWGRLGCRISEEIMRLSSEERAGCAAVVMQLMEWGGERKTGLHGEKVTWKHIWDFLQAGIPAVASALFFSEEGGKLAGTFYYGEKGGATIYAVDPYCLAKQAARLKGIAAKIKRVAEEAERVREQLKASMKNGFPYSLGIGGKIRKETEKLDREAEQFLKMAKTLEEVAQIYAVCDLEYN